MKGNEMEKNIFRMLQDVEIELLKIDLHDNKLGFRFRCAVQATITAIQAVKKFF